MQSHQQSDAEYGLERLACRRWWRHAALVRLIRSRVSPWHVRRSALSDGQPSPIGANTRAAVQSRYPTPKVRSNCPKACPRNGFVSNHRRESSTLARARRDEVSDQRRLDLLRLGVVDLTRARRPMAAAAIAQAERADVDGRAAIEDRLADREHGVLLLYAPIAGAWRCGTAETARRS